MSEQENREIPKGERTMAGYFVYEDGGRMRISGGAVRRWNSSGQIQAKGCPCLAIDASNLFKDEEFVCWLNQTKDTATWHKPDTEPEGYSDIFMTYDHGEGSDMDIPSHCWDFICEVCGKANFPYGVLWLRESI